jgi:hypothetical protein
MKQVIWMGSSKEDLRAFPGEARREVGYQLEHIQEGVDPDDWKPMSTVGSGVREIRVRESSGASLHLPSGAAGGNLCLARFPKEDAEDAEDQSARFGLGAEAI